MRLARHNSNKQYGFNADYVLLQAWNVSRVFHLLQALLNKSSIVQILEQEEQGFEL